MTRFEDAHDRDLEELVDIPGHRVVTMLGCVDAHATDASGNIVHVVAGFRCPVVGCEALHPELALGRIVSES